MIRSLLQSMIWWLVILGLPACDNFPDRIPDDAWNTMQGADATELVFPDSSVKRKDP